MLNHEEQILLYRKYEKSTLLKELEKDYNNLLIDIFEYKKEDINKDFFNRLKRIEDPVLKKNILQLIVSNFEYLLFKSENLKEKINILWKPHFQFKALKIEAQGGKYVLEAESDYEAFKFLLEMKNNLKEHDYIDLEIVPFPEKAEGNSFLRKFELDFQNVANSFFLSKSFATGNKKLMNAIEERTISYVKKNCLNNVKDFVAKTITSNNNNGSSFIRFLLSNEKVSGDIEFMSSIENYLTDLLSDDNQNSIVNFELKVNDIVIGLLENKIYTDKQIYNLIFSNYLEIFSKKSYEENLFALEIGQRMMASKAYSEMRKILDKDVLKSLHIGNIEGLAMSKELEKSINNALLDTPFDCRYDYTKSSRLVYIFKLKDGLNMRDLSDKDLDVMKDIKKYIFLEDINVNQIEDELLSVIEKRKMIEDVKVNISQLTKKTAIKKF